MTKLSKSQIAEALAQTPAWRLSDDGAAIERRFEFADFPGAMAFMARAAVRIDALDHHPEWSNVYNRLDVRLTTHDSGGLTAKDFALAQILDDLAG